MTYYKVLGEDRRPVHGGSGRWPEPGGWLSVDPPLVPCGRGLHLCRPQDLVSWLGPEIWVAEVHPDAEIVERADKIVVSRARLVSRVEAWDESVARWFAADCAERVLHLYERERPGDDRPRRAVETARAFARGDASADDLDAAWDAARDAARAAAWAADRAADRAAWDAARHAARHAAWAAVWAAQDAAAWAAVWAVAWAAERAWQTQRLLHYLGETS